MCLCGNGKHPRLPRGARGRMCAFVCGKYLYLPPRETGRVHVCMHAEGIRRDARGYEDMEAFGRTC